ncbi:hypothetical protein BK816_02770 [Boudabousia tangfeifanii]|uniref:THIF-type NAD/FAD binding fold domain-containing protein n=1 Tax=Boudabousia tangfeifanii TaxID=1912795 RepID=A0A1D9MJ93_9ACTO|nr:hypothetical protein [Boudabousia tangfeifanii]AOZ72356.1 hypothetical protein BK816_02770 [Boudabousia tangfeifanii]
MQPKLRAGLPVISRRNGELQIGSDPKYGVILTGLTWNEQALLDWLSRRYSPSRFERHRKALGVSKERLTELLEILDQHGLLESDPLRQNAASAEQMLCARLDGHQSGYLRRKDKSVQVFGANSLGTLVAALLGNAEIGNVVVSKMLEPPSIQAFEHFPFSAHSYGQSRMGTIGDFLRNYLPKNRSINYPTHDLSIIISAGSFPATLAKLLAVDDQPFLMVTYTEMGLSVGPLIHPALGPCPQCIDLHKTDLDSAWPIVADALQGTFARANPPSIDSATLATAAGFIVRIVLDFLDNRNQVPIGTQLYIPTYDTQIQHSFWQAHPSCQCQRFSFCTHDPVVGQELKR